jgi:hypothetical protein
MRRLLPIGCVLLLTGVGMCDPTGNDLEIQGRFLIDEISGRRLPAPISDSLWVLSGELRIVGDTYTKTMLHRLDWGGPSRTVENTATGQVDFNYPYASFALTDQAGTKRGYDIVDDNTLRQISDFGRIIIYRRAPQE